MNRPIRLALLASGNGTNVQQITEYLADKEGIEVNCILYNKKDAFVAERAKKLGIEAHYFCRRFGVLLRFLQQRGVDWLILAGFSCCWCRKNLLAASLIMYKHSPALLTAMAARACGHRVHEAVVPTMTMTASPSRGGTYAAPFSGSLPADRPIPPMICPPRSHLEKYVLSPVVEGAVTWRADARQKNR